MPSSGGVAFRIVMAMKQHFAGEARAALLAAMTANMRPKIVIVVDPDIDVPPNALGPVQVALMIKRGLRDHRSTPGSRRLGPYAALLPPAQPEVMATPSLEAAS